MVDRMFYILVKYMYYLIQDEKPGRSKREDRRAAK
jgi:hypothetical protein